MKIESNKVVQMHYHLTDEDKNVLDSSKGRDPLAYIHGVGNIIPGLEKQLTGKSVGDKVEAIVAPAEGYGERDENLMQVVPKSGFQEVSRIFVFRFSYSPRRISARFLRLEDRADSSYK